MNDHWLVRESTIKRLWVVFAVVLVATILMDFFVQQERHFWLDGTFGFGAWFGFISCVVLILLAKAVGAVLKRPDNYYDR